MPPLKLPMIKCNNNNNLGEREREMLYIFDFPPSVSLLPFTFFLKNKHYRVLIVLLFLFFSGASFFCVKIFICILVIFKFYRHLIFLKILISSSPPGKFDRKEVGFDSRDEYHPDMTDDSSACLNAHFLISIIFENGPQRHKNLNRNKNIKFNIFIFISDDGRRIVRAGKNKMARVLCRVS
jgi:hypothetical protein